MTDRLTLIMELGAVATDAAQRGDDRAAQTCRAAAELLFADKSAVDAMAHRRKRDREARPAKRPRIPRTTSHESTESDEIGRIGFAPQGFSPTPPFPNPPDNNGTTPRARRKVAGRVSTEYVQMVEHLTQLLVERVGPLWTDLEAFLNRRPYETWKGWLKEMLALLTGGKFTPDDVAQSCRDDEALERPIGSPAGLRAFVGNAQRARTETRNRRGNGSQDERVGPGEQTYRNARAALEGL